MIQNLNSPSSDSSELLEWVREKDLLKRIQISRSLLFELRKTTKWFRYVSIVQRGNIKGITIYHFPTITDNLKRIADEQNDQRNSKLPVDGGAE